MCLKLFKDDEFRTSLGNEFNSLGAENENDLSNTDDRDLRIANVPLADDLSARLCVSDTGFNRFEIYSGVKLCKALYIKTALLYLIRWLMESHPSSLNISMDGVL